jgi:hypothetical protein
MLCRAELCNVSLISFVRIVVYVRLTEEVIKFHFTRLGVWLKGGSLKISVTLL